METQLAELQRERRTERRKRRLTTAVVVLAGAALVVHSDISRTDFAPGDVVSSSAVNAQLNALYAEVNSYDDCPGGFTLLAAAGRAVGCIQNTENAMAGWFPAMDVCKGMGGRLPTHAEWYWALSELMLTDEDDNHEWFADYVYEAGGAHGAGGLAGLTAETFAISSGAVAYRCWLPR